MLLTEIEKTKGVVSIIKTKADLPNRPEGNQVKVFLDFEGGGPIQYEEREPDFHPDRRPAMLRNFLRLGAPGRQLTHNGRNMLGVGIAEGSYRRSRNPRHVVDPCCRQTRDSDHHRDRPHGEIGRG
jgi:hypothetical protein